VLQYFQPVQFGHFYITEDDIVGVFFDLVEAHFAIFGFVYLKRLKLQNLPQGVPDGSLIINDQDLWHREENNMRGILPLMHILSKGCAKLGEKQ